MQMIKAPKYLAGLMAAAALVAGTASAQAGGKVVELTQTGCQFLESENGIDHKFQPQKAADCVAHNKTDGNKRLTESKVIRLKPGEYTFRVTNRDVPYSLGFWLRSADYNPSNPLHKLTKTSVSGGGLHTGVTKDYNVTLKPGEYVYSCPLNPTLDYKLVVGG